MASHSGLKALIVTLIMAGEVIFLSEGTITDPSTYRAAYYLSVLFPVGALVVLLVLWARDDLESDQQS